MNKDLESKIQKDFLKQLKTPISTEKINSLSQYEILLETKKVQQKVNELFNIQKDKNIGDILNSNYSQNKNLKTIVNNRLKELRNFVKTNQKQIKNNPLEFVKKMYPENNNPVKLNTETQKIDQKDYDELFKKYPKLGEEYKNNQLYSEYINKNIEVTEGPRKIKLITDFIYNNPEKYPNLYKNLKKNENTKISFEDMSKIKTTMMSEEIKPELAKLLDELKKVL